MKKSILAIALMGISLSSVFADSSLPPASRNTNYSSLISTERPSPQSASLTTAHPASSPSCTNLGANLESPSFFSASEPFINLAITAEPWHRQWGSRYKDMPIRVDSNGNPLDASPDMTVQAMINAFNWTDTVPTEPYVLTWDGNGVITVGGAVKVISNNTHRIVFNFKGKTAAWMNATADASDPVHNIRIVPLSYEHSHEIFAPDFLNMVRNFKTLRFMDWTNTNGTLLQHWKDRPTPAEASISKYGVPYEYIVALANRLNCDVWINIPAEADDDYIRQMAHFFRKTLKPGQKVYVEYTNEAWNFMMPQWAYLNNKAIAAGYSKSPVAMYYSDQVAKIADIWHAEFNDPSGPKAVVIMAGQEYWSAILQQEMDHNNNGEKVDATSVAFYFMGNRTINAQNAAQWRTSTPDQLIQAGIAGLPDVASAVNLNVSAVAKYNKPMIFYEGGQNLVQAGKEPDGSFMRNDTPVMNLLLNANRDTLMSDLYIDALQTWQSKLGGGLFMLYNVSSVYTQWGYWGMQEKQDFSSAINPKRAGVDQFCRWPIISNSTSTK